MFRRPQFATGRIRRGGHDTAKRDFRVEDVLFAAYSFGRTQICRGSRWLPVFGRLGSCQLPLQL